MKINGLLCLSLVALMSASALAADVVPEVVQDQPVTSPAEPATWPIFGYIEGGYILPEYLHLYNTYDAGHTVSEGIGPGDGWRGKGLLGFHFTPEWSIIGAGEYGISGTGGIHNGADRYSYLQDNYMAVDGLVGYNITPNWRVSGGARWAKWNNLTTDGGQQATPPAQDSGRFYIYNNFEGIGPRLQVDGSVPLLFGNDNLTLEAGAGASYFFDKMHTYSTGNWASGTDTTNSGNAFNVDASVGVGYRFGANVRAVIGMQGQYWNGINVAVNEDSAWNKVPVGQSAQLQAGPFVRLAF